MTLLNDSNTTQPAPLDRQPGDDSNGFNAWLRKHPWQKPMGNEEIAMHKLKAQAMVNEKRPLGEIKAYLDTAGVPRKPNATEYAPGTDQHLGGMLMSALHGATFGWDDEGVGSLYGLVSGVGAQAGRDAYRRQLQEFHNANPGTDLVMQMVGGGGVTGFARKALGIAAPKAADWLMHLGAAKKLIGGGMAAGAAYAAGDQQGGVGGRLGAAVGGAALGGVMAGAIGGAGAVAGKIVKPMLRGNKFLQELAPKTFPKTMEDVDNIMLRDIANDGTTPGEMLMKAEAMHQMGLTPTVADLAGENVMNRMQSVQGASGKGMQAIKAGFKERQVGEGDRVIDWLVGDNKLGLQNIEQVENGFLGARQMDGKLLYEEAYQHAAPMTDKLKALFDNEKFRDAWNQARLELQQQPGGRDIGPLAKPLFPDMGGPFYSASVEKGPPSINLKTGAVSQKTIRVPPKQGPPEAIRPTELSVAGLDYTKRYLDRIIRQADNKSASGWSKGVAHGLSQNLEEALIEIDKSVPSYGEARRLWRSDSRVLDALEKGRTFLRANSDEIEMAMQNHESTAETEAFKLGVMTSVRHAIEGNRQKVPDQVAIFYGKGMAKKIRAVFGKDADDMLERVRIEARFGEVYGKTLGSRTANMMGMMAENEAQAASILGAVVAQRPGTAAIYSARMMGQMLKLKHGGQVADEMANVYTRGLEDPAELIGYLLKLSAKKPHVSHTALYTGAALGGPIQGNPYNSHRR